MLPPFFRLIINELYIVVLFIVYIVYNIVFDSMPELDITVYEGISLSILLDICVLIILIIMFILRLRSRKFSDMLNAYNLTK